MIEQTNIWTWINEQIVIVEIKERTWGGESLPDRIEELVEIAFDGRFEIAGMQTFAEGLFQILVSAEGQVAAIGRRSTHAKFWSKFLRGVSVRWTDKGDEMRNEGPSGYPIGFSRSGRDGPGLRMI